VNSKEIFTPEEINYVLELSKGILTEGNEVSTTSVTCELVYVDLESLVTETFGISDPIGQIAQYIQNALNNVASWIVDRVRDSLKWLWDTFIKPGLDAVQRLIESAYSGILDSFEYFFNSVYSWISEVGTTVTNALTAFAERVWDAINSVSTAFSAVAQQLWDYIQSLTNTIAESIAQLWGWIQEGFTQMTNVLTSFVQRVWEGIQVIPSIIEQAFTQLWTWVQGALVQVSNVLQGIASRIWEGLQWLSTQVVNALQQVWSVMQSIPNYVMQGLQTLWSWIQQGFTEFMNILQGLASRIWGGIQWIGTQLTTAFQTLWGWIQSGLAQLANIIQGITSRIWEGLQWVGTQLANVVERVWDALQSVGSWIESAISQLWGWIQTGLAQLTNAFTEVATRIWGGIQWLVNAVENIPSLITSAIEDMVKEIWGGIQWLGTQFANLITKVLQYLSDLGAHIEQLSRYIYRLGVIVTGGFNSLINIPKELWSLVPDWFMNAFNAIYNVFSTLGKYVSDLPKFFSDLIGWVVQGLKSAWGTVWEGIQWFASQLMGGLSWLSQQIQGAWGAFQGFINWLAGAIKELASALWGALYKAGAFISDLLTEPLKAGLEGMGKSIAEALGRFKEALQGRQGEWDLFFGITMSFMPSWLVATVAPRFLKAVAGTLKGVRFRVGIPGTNIQFNLSPAYFLYELGDKLEGLMNRFGEAILMGMGLVTLLPLRRIYIGLWKHFFDTLGFADVPFEIPTAVQIRDVIRRSLFMVDNLKQLKEGKYTKEFSDVIERARWILEMRGYPTWFIHYWMDLGKVYSMSITDRFGTSRFIPFSPIFEIPSKSEIVRMLQRDVFASPMEWSRFVRVYGMSDDLARMFYMLSFEYPSFTQLWKFMVRGISGMLWYVPPDFIHRWFAQDAKWLGAGVPVAPYVLNYDYNALFKAIPFYLKWIQKSNFSWFRKGAKIRYGNMEIEIDFNWTADSWMLWDISADIPGKIDARWMAKWALFDYISTKSDISIPRVGEEVKAYPQTPFIDLMTNVVSKAMTSTVYMDLRPFCRLLVANGLHPAWVPITAVAEAINALSDERTLLRTGFIHLYKEGFWGFSDLDTLLNGFVTASFAVEYFDVVKRQWVGGAINVPVKFLPAERRLLELRAVMDRAYDILKDLARELGRAYAENIIQTHDTFKAELEEGIERVNSWFIQAMKQITGKEYPLKMDTPYWDSYAKVLDIYHMIYTYHRVRYWIGRILGWSIYRLAYGYVSVQDIKKIVKVFGTYGRLTDKEVELIEKVADMLAGVAGKQYIPTPSQLATIAEVIPSAVKKLPDVLKAHRVPESWWGLWSKYVEIKPIVDEVRKLLTVYERAMKYRVDIGELKEEVIKVAEEAGWTERELKILSMRVAVEELIEEAKELRKQYLPTPLSLATLAEYVTVPAKLVQEVLQRRGVPKEWVSLWVQYVKVRPLADEARLLATAFFKAERYGVPLGKLKEEVEEILKSLGFTEEELKLRYLRATIEAMIDEWKEERKEYIPTPSMLATIAEYIPSARKLITKVFEARHVPEEWRKIWVDYISIKPIYNELRTYLTTVMTVYEHFVIDTDTFNQIIMKLSSYGYEEAELQLIINTAGLRRQYYAYREVIGTPRSLVAMAEYSPTARSVALGVVNEMIDALPVDTNTKKFLKAMWEEFIRIKPVYNEVRSYVSELIMDYAKGVISKQELLNELNTLKKWGLDDYEIQFYMYLAERRRLRYARSRR